MVSATANDVHRNLILVTDTCLDEHTVAAVCKYNIATADPTLIVQQAAKTSKSSSIQNC